MRTKNNGGASVRERKAAALDTLVKTELTKKRTAEATKMSNLRALRLAKEAEQPSDTALDAEVVKSKFPARRTVRARS
jgi:ribosomal protein L14E/L6E/L27E